MALALRLLRDQFGLDFSLYKTSTVTRRILRRVELLGSQDLSAYTDRLRMDPEELSLLYHDLLIGVTKFFRDPEAFEVLEKQIVPEIVQRVPDGDEIRIWVAGCATGEESYSIAMLFFEQLTAAGRQLNVKILSTDVHAASLAHASSGFYCEEQLEHVTEKRRERFFSKKPGGYQISQDLRQLIVFAPHNVTKDAPFTKMHFITCRNLLIYLEQPAQKTVLSLFHFGLTTGGFLFLGASETPGAVAHEFDVIDEHWKIYRKRREVRLLQPLDMPIKRKAASAMHPSAVLARPPVADPQVLAVYDQLLDRHMPPSFLVNEDRHLVDSFGGAERLFKLGKRRPSINILDLLEGDLRTVVAGAIQHALKKEGAVRYTGVAVPDGNTWRRCAVSAEPFVNQRTGSTHVLICVQNEIPDSGRQPQVRDTHVADVPATQASQEHLATLEGELSYTRETLQSTIEELQTSNEELQATNEELVASNEELQSTNEELHSVNEELYTVNAEYQKKIGELRELNSDMQHSLESTDAGTLFLDRNLCIRKYTPRIAGISALESARSRLRQLSAIVESSKDAIIGTTLNGTITSWNKGAEDLYGYSQAEAIGCNISVLAPSGFTDDIIGLDGLQREQRVENVQAMHVRKDGTIVDVSVTVSPVCDAEGNIAGASAIGRDITQLRTAERDLAERESRIRLLLESTAEAIIGLGTDGACTFSNPACARMLGYESSDDLIGKHIHNLIHHSHADGSPHGEENCSMCSVLSTGKGTHSDEETLWRADGTGFLAECWSYPLRHEGRMVGVVVTFIDITGRKKAEQEIRTAARRREEFLAMLSHELPNPLTAVVCAARVMRSSSITPDLLDKSRQIVERQSRHMTRLLDDLLDVSRITRGGIELCKEDVDLRDAIGMAVEALSPVLEERNVKLVTDIAGEMLPVRGDAARLQQVIGNLLSNAARYSPPGKTIVLSAAVDGDAVVLKVKDQGRGISPSMLSEIFELFVQNEQGLDRANGGLGIGLTLVRKIVEIHGGNVEACSEGPGTGSEFVVTLPRQRHAVVLQNGAHHANVPRRVLVVEDQDDSREMLRVLLQSKGHLVIEEADGRAAVEAIEREHPDIALIDIGIPLMSGYDVARKVRQNSVFDDVVLVALTGYGSDADVKAAVEAGFNDHLTKPADPQLIDEILLFRTRRKAKAS